MTERKIYLISVCLVVIVVGGLWLKFAPIRPPHIPMDTSKQEIEGSIKHDEFAERPTLQEPLRPIESREIQEAPRSTKVQEPQKIRPTEPQPPKIESPLAGKVICIDAGHQQSGNNTHEPIAPGSKITKPKVSSGTKGVAIGKYEYELNLEVALLLKEALLEKGTVVYMVRETNDVDISNAERAQLANEVNADLSLRIHADAAENSSANGFSILVPGKDFVAESIVSKSQDFAKNMENSLSGSIPNSSRGIITRNDLTGFNWTQVPAILIEMGFMSNSEEDKRMNTKAFQDSLVKAIVEGLEMSFQGTDPD